MGHLTVCLRRAVAVRLLGRLVPVGDHAASRLANHDRVVREIEQAALLRELEPQPLPLGDVAPDARPAGPTPVGLPQRSDDHEVAVIAVGLLDRADAAFQCRLEERLVALPARAHEVGHRMALKLTRT